MSRSANVHYIPALDDLSGALGQFSGEGQEVLDLVDQEIRRTQEWLRERLNRCLGEVRRGKEAVSQARADLADCRESRRYERYYVDCSPYREALDRAKGRLHEAQRELRNVQKWTRLVAEAAHAYRAEAEQFKQVLRTDVPRARALLVRKITELQTYLAG